VSGTGYGDTGVVDQNVQTVELGEGRGDHRLDLRRITDIGAQDECAPAERPYIARDVVGGLALG
jgi:hypothetical protein